jgi:large subunit ribosomal protein L25
MKKHTLSAAVRELVGRKVKQLRAENQIPATVYGKGVKSISVTVALDAFEEVYEETGETGLIELAVGKEVRPVLVHMVQVDPVSDALLHVEFHQVDLKEKVHAKVPVEIVGESPAVAQKLGVLLTVLDAIEVEALPTDLPEKIAVDVSVLAEVDQEVKVEQLHVGSSVTVLTDGSLTIVKVGPLVTKEAEAQAAEEAAAAEVAGAEAGAANAETAGAEEKSSSEAKPTEEKAA